MSKILFIYAQKRIRNSKKAKTYRRLLQSFYLFSRVVFFLLHEIRAERFTVMSLQRESILYSCIYFRECQRSVLFLFIYAQKRIRNSKKAKTYRRLLQSFYLFSRVVFFLLHEIRAERFTVMSLQRKRFYTKRVNIEMFADSRKKKEENSKDYEAKLIGK